MRIWSVHPRYLDRQGLTACWREGLLAQKVLTGATKGYRNHPQLRRFRAAGDGPSLDGPPAVGPAPGGDGAAGAVPALGTVLGGHEPGTTVEIVPEARAGPAISTYLHAVVDEAAARGYSFDRRLVLGPADPDLRLDVTDRQLAYEWAHLRAKLAVRSPDVLRRWADVDVPEAHPLFHVVAGPVAEWEIVTVIDLPDSGPPTP